MKTILAILFSFAAFTASAQYRYNLYSLATNAIDATSISNYTLSASVAASTRADIQLAFTLISSNHPTAMSATCSNPVTALFDFSIDGTRFTNQLSVTLNAQSNATVWHLTNVMVTNAAWIRLVSITNANHAKLTNLTVKVGSKTGL